MFSLYVGSSPNSNKHIRNVEFTKLEKHLFWRCHHHLKVLRPICGVATWHKDQLINWKFVSILHHHSDNSHFIYYVYIIISLIN